MKIGEVSAMASSQRYKSVSVRLQHSVRGSFVTPLCRVERMEGLVLARRRRPSLGRQEICAVGKDSMTIWRQCAEMCWCLLTGIGSLRRSVTVPSRRLGGRRPRFGGPTPEVPRSGLQTRIPPVCLMHWCPRFSKTWPRDFLSSSQTYTSLVSGNRKESGHCVSNLAGQIYVCLSTEATVR